MANAADNDGSLLCCACSRRAKRLDAVMSIGTTGDEKKGGSCAAPCSTHSKASMCAVLAGGLSGNSKSLLVMFSLFTLITGTQYVAAMIAHSLALQADCASMGAPSPLRPTPPQSRTLDEITQLRSRRCALVPRQHAR